VSPRAVLVAVAIQNFSILFRSIYFPLCLVFENQ